MKKKWVDTSYTFNAVFLCAEDLTFNISCDPKITQLCESSHSLWSSWCAAETDLEQLPQGLTGAK